MNPEADTLDVGMPLGLRVTCSRDTWWRISRIKHPPMRARLDDVRTTLRRPDAVRRSSRNPDVVLFHRQDGRRWICAVVDRSTEPAHLVTAYPADKIKHGEIVWER